MQNKVLSLFMSFVFLSVTAGSASACLFSSTENFAGTGSYLGNDYLELSGSGSGFVFDYTHTVTFSTPASSINFANVSLTHHNNSDNPGELWFLSCGTECQLGVLSRSTGDGWVTDTFAIPNELYQTIQGGSWSLMLSLKETTSGTDKLWIDKSVLSGTYAPVPIPPAVFLFGSGLSGLFFFRRKKAAS